MKEKLFEEYDKLHVATDIIVLTTDMRRYDAEKSQQSVQVMLMKRAEPTTTWALPGGFVSRNTGVTECARVKLQEKTGLSKVYMEQLKTYGDKTDRDSRGRVVSVAHVALASKEELESNRGKATIEGTEAQWFWLNSIRDSDYNVVDIEFESLEGHTVVTELAFDHKQMVMDAINRVRNKCEYTNVIFHMMPAEFKLRDLESVYTWVVGHMIPSFRRKIAVKVKSTDKVSYGDQHRPAVYHTFNGSLKTEESGVV